MYIIMTFYDSLKIGYCLMTNILIETDTIVYYVLMYNNDIVV